LRYVWQLGRDARFCEIVDRHTAEVLLASALLHDLGHWPFCHPIEDMKLPGLPPHEAFAAEFLAPGSPLAEVLQRDWGIEPDEVLDVLVTRTDTPALRLLRSILSGPIDIDKMDYLGRDSLHCGVPYGRHFDRNRLMSSLVTNAAGDGLAISSKGRTAAELMVFARYVMFSEVYWHHAVRSATSMFARAFFHLHEELDLETFFRKSVPKVNSTRTLRITLPNMMIDRITAKPSSMAARVQKPMVADCSLVMLSKMARVVSAMPCGISAMLTVRAPSMMKYRGWNRARRQRYRHTLMRPPLA
jgi:HD superfamily phosphohydrolase